MVATTRRSTDVADAEPRFDANEKALHWVNAALFAILIFTGASLYVGPLSTIVGRRELMKTIHVYAGLALPVPFLLAYLGPWRASLRADVARLNRWQPEDWKWLRRRGGFPVKGKFNAGQKLNAAFVAGAVVVMLATGSIMRWYEPFPLDWRTGATFVHDWLFLALVVVITGHIVMAARSRRH